MIPYELHAGWTAVRRRGCCICSATSTSLTIGCTGRRRPGCRIRTRFGSQQRTDSGSTRLKSSRKVRSRVQSSASQASRILRSQRLYGHAREFREIGLTTLMPDLRGHGDIDGDRICLAYNETADIKAVTEYVKATYTDIPVIVMGLSMGGGVAIRSIGENDDIDALITLSASAGVCQECLRTTSNAGRNSRSVRRRHAQGLHGRPGGRWR